ncbi:MAG: hypothetical protein JXB50_16420 [Spirochaetes bacterium]|nr:hypothetical protein [Spirochaetota bacterium]
MNDVRTLFLTAESAEGHRAGRTADCLGYVYYFKKSKNFEDIIRHGKLLNCELVKTGLANRYGQ